MTQKNENKKEISAQEILFILSKRKIAISVIILLSVIVSIFYTLTQKSIYKSTGMIMIESNNTMNIFDAVEGSDRKELDNEIAILYSRTAAERTINRLLESEYKNNLFLFNTRKYIHPYFPFLNSGDNFSEINNTLSDELYNEILLSFRNSININNPRNTDIIYISINSIDPKEAALLVNTLMSVYRDMDLEWATGEMTHLKSFLTEQIEKKEQELTVAENELKNFQEREKIFTVDSQSKILLDNLLRIEAELYNVKAENNILTERKKYFNERLTDEEKKLSESVTNTINDRLFALKKEIVAKESELISTISQKGEKHQYIDALRNKIERLKSAYKEETEDLISKGISVSDPLRYRQELMDSVINFSSLSAMLEVKIKELQKQSKNYEIELSALPEKELLFTKLSRNLNIKNETYSLMRQKFEESRIVEASQVGKVRIIDLGKPNDIRISPKRKLDVLIGTILGTFLAICMVLIIHFLDPTIKSIEELEYRGLSIIALIPSMGSSIKNKKTVKYQMKLGEGEKIKRRLIINEDPKSPISEAFRSLRTSIDYNNSTRNNSSHVILISSPGPGEGKTTNIANLAIAYANLGKKTVIIDSDLRKPVTHKIFQVNRDNGLSMYLSGKIENHGDIIKDTGINNLSLIPCDIIPPNPSEILGNDKMDSLIEQLKKEFDIILFDAPPLLAVTDAFVTMKYVDDFVLVVRPSKTERGGLDRALDLIQQTKTPLYGVIANDVDASTTYGGGYYYNYYQYYYEEGKV